MSMGGGQWVRFSDVQARLGEKSGEIDRLSEELDQANARIRELEDDRAGLVMENRKYRDDLEAQNAEMDRVQSAADRLAEALAAYRSVGKNQEGQE